MKKNVYYVTVTLTFDPKSPISIGPEPVKFGASVKLEFSLLTDVQTDRQTDTHDFV